MKVHLVKRRSIEGFVGNNSQSRKPFDAWLYIIDQVNWQIPQDMVSTFNSADILGESSNRVVFNIGGDKYRIICKYFFGARNVHLFVTWIGTHSEYTKLCDNEKQYH